MIAIGIALGFIFYCLSLVIIGRKNSTLHYLLVIFVGITAFMLGWGDLTPTTIKGISTGFCIPNLVFFIIRFGKHTLPEKATTKVR